MVSEAQSRGMMAGRQRERGERDAALLRALHHQPPLLRTTLLRLGSLAFLAALAPLAPACAGPPSDVGAAPAVRDRTLTSRDLAHLREAELSERTDELWRIDPRLALRATVLRVGREIPPNLTSARRAEREAARAEALGWLTLRLEDGDSALELWTAEVDELLADRDQVQLWCATARCLGRLGAYERAPALAAELDADSAPRAQAARLALFDLFLRWFEDRAAFEAFWVEAAPSCQESAFMETARAMEREAREHLVRLLTYEPQRAEALLEHPDPRLRAAAAAALGRARNGESAAALEKLLAHLEQEPHGLAFQATIDALLQGLAGAPVESPELVRLREVLARRLREDRSADLQAPIADALRRLKWAPTSTGDASLSAGLRLLVSQARQLSGSDSLTDRDVLVTVLDSLQALARRGESEGLDVRVELERVAPLVFDLVQDRREAEVVRIAAAQLLPRLGDAEGLRRAAEVLDAEGTSAALRYHLMAAVGELAKGLDPQSPAAQLVLDTLLARLGSEDANLRRRALEVLRAEELQPLVGGADPSVFLNHLGLEAVPELQAQLLELVAQFGGPAQVDGLLELPNFDAIVESGPAGVARLAQTLEDLSDGDGSVLVRGAERLLAAGEEGTRVLRLREALELCAVIADGSLTGLTAAEHHAIVGWATELREAAGTLPGGAGFLDRLLLQHLPGCAGGAAPEAQLEHVRALFLSDRIALDPEAGEAGAVLAHFDRALELATGAGDDLRRALVLRDRARFGFEVGRSVAALADYRTLFASQLPAVPVAASDSAAVRRGVLDLGDLRRGGGLLAAASEAGDPEARDLAREALRVSLVLVQDPIWKLEPGPVRAQDLADLADRALGAGDAGALEQVSSIFADLPDLPPLPEPTEEDPRPEAQAPPPGPEGALWGGLLEDRERHQALLGLRDRLREARAAAEAEQGEGDPAGEADDPPPAELAPEEESPAPDAEDPAEKPETEP